MDLRSLKYIITIAEELNITRAAEKLNMSQPPLSNQMKQLEGELGTQLFIRGKRRLKLTEAGDVLYRRAKQILELSEQTEEEIRSIEGLSGQLNIGLVEGRAPYLLARWIAGFRLEFPNVSFNLWNGSGDDVLERLRRGLADLALIAAPYNTELMDDFRSHASHGLQSCQRLIRSLRRVGSFFRSKSSLGSRLPSRADAHVWKPSQPGFAK